MRIKYVFFIVVCFLVTRTFAQIADQTTGCAPLFVKFTAPTGYTKYHWNFGNIGSSDSANATRTYPTPGTYKVTLTEGVNGKLIDSVTITVFTKPVPKITTPDPLKGCVPLVVHLLGGRDTVPKGVTINSYIFDYGDGSPSETTLPNVPVTKTYVKTGKFTVSLVIQTSLSSCNNTLQFANYISTSLPPATNFTTTPDPPTACAPPLPVSFTNTTTSALPLTYVWKVGTNPPFTGVTPPSINLTTNGTYTVTLTATDSNKCSSTKSTIISIGKPKASFTVKNTVCLKTLVSMTNNSSGGTYQWDFGAGATPATSTLTNPSVTYTTPGTKDIKLTVVSNGCTNDTMVQIVVEDPVVDFTANPVYSCNDPMKVNFSATMTGGTPGTWSWSFRDPRETPANNTSTLQNPTHTYTLRDSIYDKREMKVYRVQLIGITAAGCRDTIIKNDTLYPAWARFVPDKWQGCAPLTVTFSDSSRSNPIKEPLTNWDWDFGDGVKVPATTKAPQTHTYTTPGVYTVQLIVKNKNGCKDTSYPVTIEVGDTKGLTFTASPTTVCPGDSILLTNTTADKTGIDAWHYSSNGDLFSHCSSEDTIKVVFNDSTGIRNIILTGDYNGCVSNSAPIAVNVKGPIAKLHFKQECDKPLEAVFDNLKSGLVSKYTFDFGDGTKLDTVGPVKISHKYAVKGDYKVKLTATNDTSGCRSSVDSVTVHIREIKAVFALQKALCLEKSYELDAKLSVDVNVVCNRGYSWVFSDSTKRPITNGNPSSITKFNSTGDQTLSLIVEDINGCKDTTTTPIKVYKVKTDFTISKNPICLPTVLGFKTVSIAPPLTVADTTIATWSWKFGDGSSIDIPGKSGDTTHLYTLSPDTTQIVLKVTDQLGCSNSDTMELHIYKPKSSITITSNHPTFPKSNICLGEVITVNAADDTSHGSNLTFEWNMGDNSPIKTTQTVTHPYTASGSYIVNLKFTEVSTGCVGNLTNTVNVQDYPKTDFTSDPTNKAVLCYPRVVNFKDASVTSLNSPVTTWFWDFGNGVTADASTASTTFPKGTYDVTLISGTSYGCKDTMVYRYVVVGPEGDYTVTPTVGICRGDLVTFTTSNLKDVKSYIWDFGDGSKTTLTTAGTTVHRYSYVPASGKISVFLILQDLNQVCELPIPIDLDIHNIKSDFIVSDMTPCKGSGVIIKNTSLNGDSFEWTLGDNTTSTAIDSIIHVYNTVGKFDITLITKNDTVSCRDTLTKTIEVLPLPDVTTKGDSICPGSNAQLLVFPSHPKFSYYWSPPKDLGPDSVKSVVNLTNVSKTENYTAFVTDTNGCVGSNTALLYVFPKILPIDFDTTIVVGDTAYLPIDNLNGGINFTWTPTEGLSCLQCTRPFVHPLQDIVYNVYMVDKKQCSNNTGIFKIHVKPITFIKVPTTFTPNGDGNNDIIYVKGWGIKDLISFQIYNRWGELVFETSELSEGWNGFYKDVLQNNDVYTYKVVAMDYFDKQQELQGHINLMR
jgi:gliding motility-associated-like protein